MSIRSSKHAPRPKYIRERVMKVSSQAVPRRVPFPMTNCHDVIICKQRPPLSVNSSDRPSSPKGCLIPFRPRRSRNRSHTSNVLKASVSCEIPCSSVISLVRSHHRRAKQSSLVCSSLSQPSRYFASLGVSHSSFMFHHTLEELSSYLQYSLPIYGLHSSIFRCSTTTSQSFSVSGSLVKALADLETKNITRVDQLKISCHFGNQVSTATRQ